MFLYKLRGGISNLNKDLNQTEKKERRRELSYELHISFQLFQPFVFLEIRKREKEKEDILHHFDLVFVPLIHSRDKSLPPHSYTRTVEEPSFIIHHIQYTTTSLIIHHTSFIMISSSSSSSS